MKGDGDCVQYLCYYFEQVVRLVYTLNDYAIDLSSNSKADVVRFFGIDNTFMYSIFAPALIYAYDPALLSRLSSNANHYYLLNDDKFSTSRRHAVWADEFIGKWGSDLSRFYLAYSRPEEKHSNFTYQEFASFCKDIESKYESWVSKLFLDIQTHFNNEIPEAGSWDMFQENYFISLQSTVKQAESYLMIESFSTQEYACLILKILTDTDRFRQKYTILADSKEMRAYYRTAIALQVSAVHTISVICWPLMPRLAERLYESLGFHGKPLQRWSTVPQLLTPGQAVSSPPLIFKGEIKEEAY